MTDYSPDPSSESEHAIRSVKEAIELALSIVDPPDAHDAALLLIGKTILRDDFDSVLVLCEKGLSSGANQILRGMFERVVTLTYLNENPHEIGLLLNFAWVERQKIIEENPEEIGENISPEYVEKTKAKVTGIVKDYVGFACEKCKTLRLNERWSPKSVVTLAKEVGFMFPLIKSAYYFPAEQFWAGAAGDNQIEPGIVRGSWFNELPDAHAPDAPAHIAHWLALETLFVLKERLAIDELEEPLSRCVSDFYFVRVEQGH